MLDRGPKAPEAVKLSGFQAGDLESDTAAQPEVASEVSGVSTLFSANNESNVAQDAAPVPGGSTLHSRRRILSFLGAALAAPAVASLPNGAEAAHLTYGDGVKQFMASPERESDSQILASGTPDQMISVMRKFPSITYIGRLGSSDMTTILGPHVPPSQEKPDTSKWPTLWLRAKRTDVDFEYFTYVNGIPVQGKHGAETVLVSAGELSRTNIASDAMFQRLQSGVNVFVSKNRRRPEFAHVPTFGKDRFVTGPVQKFSSVSILGYRARTPLEAKLPEKPVSAEAVAKDEERRAIAIPDARAGIAIDLSKHAALRKWLLEQPYPDQKTPITAEVRNAIEARLARSFLIPLPDEGLEGAKYFIPPGASVVSIEHGTSPQSKLFGMSGEFFAIRNERGEIKCRAYLVDKIDEESVLAS